MDIKSSGSVVTSAVQADQRAGSLESAANAQRAAADSQIERKEAERAETGPGVGGRVDVDA